VTPTSGSGKTIIDRCMTDESILQTELIDEIPDDHRPDDEWIAARLRVDHEFKKRMAASVQRKFKRNFQGGMGTGYTTSDEVWSHFKPTVEQLNKWINKEGRGENRIDEQSAMKGEDRDTVNDTAKDSDSGSNDDGAALLSDADEDQRSNGSEAGTASQSDQVVHARTIERNKHDDSEGTKPTNVSAATARDTSNDPPQDTWLGMLPELRDGPQD
jgi:platelet-activating factor acetylhydrolase